MDVKEKAKRAYGFAKKQTMGEYSLTRDFVGSSSIIENILNFYQGSVKNKKILDIGCGNGWEYAPIIGVALTYLGANVTGIDISESKHFKIIQADLSNLEENVLNQVENNDLVIAKSLLNHGLMIKENGNAIYYDENKEWEIYSKIMNEIYSVNRSAKYLIQAYKDKIDKNSIIFEYLPPKMLVGDIIKEAYPNHYFCDFQRLDEIILGEKNEN